MIITITGKRSEGKSTLAYIINKLLKKYTPCTISIKEEPNVSRNFKAIQKVKRMKKLQTRSVVIDVANN